MWRRTLVLAGVLVLGFALCAVPAARADTSWTVSAGNWSDANNWSAGVPDMSTNAAIGNGGTATITQAGQLCHGLTLGLSPGESGTIRIDSGTLTADTNHYIGLSGTGSVVQNGGTYVLLGGNGDAQLGPRLYMANAPGSLGTYELQGPGSLSAYLQYVGAGGGTGIFRQSDGNNAAWGLRVGFSSGSSGTYELSGTGRLFAGQSVGVGTSRGTGTFTQTGGCITTSLLVIGFGLGTGSYEISEGNLVVAPVGAPGSGINIGGNGSGTGTLRVSGGVVTLDGVAYSPVKPEIPISGSLIVGYNQSDASHTRVSRFFLTGGVVNLEGPILVGRNSEFHLGDGILRSTDSNLYVNIQNCGLFHVMSGTHSIGVVTDEYPHTFAGTIQVDANATLSVGSIQHQTLEIHGTLIVREFQIGAGGNEDSRICDSFRLPQ